MQENKYLSTVIYPESLGHLSEDSYLIGWNIEQFHCLIATSIPKRLVPNDTKLKDILGKVYSDPSFIAGRSRQITGINLSPSPLVLGTLVVEDKNADDEPSSQQQQSSIWVTLQLETSIVRRQHESEIVLSTNKRKLQKLIRLKSIYSVGLKYQSSCYLISYIPKNTDVFECLKTVIKDDFNGEKPVNFNLKYQSKMKVDMDLITNNVNASSDLHKFVSSYLDIDMYGKGEWRMTWVERTEESIVNFLSRVGVWFYLIGYFTNIRISSFIPMMSWFYRHFQWSNLVALNAKTKTPKPDKIDQLHNDSLTVHELSFFLFAISYRCSQINKLLKYTASLSLSWNINIRARQYLWLLQLEIMFELLVDIILGFIFGYYLYRSGASIVENSENWATYLTNKTLLDTIAWFNNSPGGVKLNPFITKKMGVLVQFFIRISAKYYFACKFLVLPACWLIACLGFTGFSIQLCVIIDLLRIITWPVNISHIIFSAVFGFLMRLLYSLWLLFNGQKKNVLRDRVDTFDYDPSVVLFGVMLFSIMLFAIPNFAAYHYLFVSLRICIVAIMFLVWQMLLFVKDFPWVKLFCLVFYPSLLQEESFLEMILVREQQTLSTNTLLSSDFSADNLDNLLHDLSPKYNHGMPKRFNWSGVRSKPSNHGQHDTRKVENEDFHQESNDEEKEQKEQTPAVTLMTVLNQSISLSPSSFTINSGSEPAEEDDSLSHSASLQKHQHDSNITPIGLNVGSIKPLSLQTPTAVSAVLTGNERWQRFPTNSQSNKISSTYFTIEQKEGRWPSVFERYIRWWSMFFIERRALSQMIWMIVESRPVYLRMLKAPILLNEQSEQYIEGVILAQTRKFFHALSTNNKFHDSSPANKILSWSGLQSILSVHYLPKISSVSSMSRSREKLVDPTYLYWQMIIASSQGFHDNLIQVFPNCMSVIGSTKVQQNRNQEERSNPNEDESQPLLNTQKSSMEQIAAEQVNFRQLQTCRRLLILALLLMIISSLLSILGMIIFIYLLIFNASYPSER